MGKLESVKTCILPAPARPLACSPAMANSLVPASPLAHPPAPAGPLAPPGKLHPLEDISVKSSPWFLFLSFPKDVSVVLPS